LIFNPAALSKWLSRVGWGVIGVVVTGVYLYYLQAQSLPDLQFWHRGDVARSVVPEMKNPAQGTLEDYLAHESDIFASLDRYIDQTDADLPGWHRYSANAHAIYRAAWPQSNRTQLNNPDEKRGAALLVHGLSDSTHSMRPLANILLSRGYQTLNLRMPGHGTLPGALQAATSRQFQSAYRLGVNALVEDLQAGQPLVLGGYSNGAALAVNYTAEALLHAGDARVPDLLILISPAMQVSPVAAYARSQRLISELPGMEKLGWTDVVAEFDPFKYNSFPVFAGEQIYKLTSRLEKNLARLTPEQLQRFPPVLAFQSVLDATIPPGSVVTALLDRLADTPVELVLFDINRNSSMLPLLTLREDEVLRRLVSGATQNFDLTVVGTASPNSDQVSVKTRRRGSRQWQQQSTDMRWPPGVFSLSHVALPFDADDPIYGTNKGDGLMRLGEIWFKGERGGLGVPLDLLARQRFNPFFPVLEQRVVEAVDRVTPR
jgi:alpha-beta hydrolase superfamily lysophospholipase